MSNSAISPEEYQTLSDDVFDSLTDSLEELTQEYDGQDADDYEVEYSVSKCIRVSHLAMFNQLLSLQSGVLNLRVGQHGTYVINKQPANKQIWFSSPTR